MSDKFREMLECFYKYVNQSDHAGVYVKALQEELDLVEEEPVHIISISQKHTNQIKMLPKKVTSFRRPPDHLYKSYDFAEVFLFSLLRLSVKEEEESFITNLQTKITDSILMIFSNEETYEFHQISSLSEYVFQFLHDLRLKNLSQTARDQLLKQFYRTTFLKRSLRKNFIEVYGNQSQHFLFFLLFDKQILKEQLKSWIKNPCSPIYDENTLDFNLVLHLWESRQEWVIGQGEKQIKIIKTQTEYIFPKQKNYQFEQKGQLDPEWAAILEQSKEIRQNQNISTDKLLTQLNLEEVKGTESVRSYRSANNSAVVRKFDFM